MSAPAPVCWRKKLIYLAVVQSMADVANAAPNAVVSVITDVVAAACRVPLPVPFATRISRSRSSTKERNVPVVVPAVII